MKKAFYVLIVMVVLLGMLPSAAEAKKTGEMHISAITGSYITQLDKYVYNANVYIVDAAGNPVVRARVSIIVNLIVDGKWIQREYTAPTEAGGVAAFYVRTESPSFIMGVTNVAKTGYTYHPELNVVDGITIFIPIP